MASILIVDDEETHARAIARFLDRRRYGTTVAVSGTQARAALAKSRPDLVLLDQRLGDEDGVTLLRETHYARKYGRPAKTLAPDAVAALLAERWIGNVRELAHVIERAMLMSDAEVVEVAHLGVEPPPGGEPAATRLDEVERTLIRRVLEECGGNVSQAARRLGVSRELLRYRMRKHGLR